MRRKGGERKGGKRGIMRGTAGVYPVDFRDPEKRLVFEILSCSLCISPLPFKIWKQRKGQNSVKQYSYS